MATDTPHTHTHVHTQREACTHKLTEQQKKPMNASTYLGGIQGEESCVSGQEQSRDNITLVAQS